MKNLLKASAMVMVIVLVWPFVTAVLAEENPEQIASVEVPVTSAPLAAPVAAQASEPAPDAEKAPAAEVAPASENSGASDLPPVVDAAQAPEETVAPAGEEEINEDAPASEDLGVDLSNASVIITCMNGSHVKLGDTVTLVAQVIGLDGVAYSMQWQYQCGGAWHDVGGANGDTYSYTFSEKNSGYAWRLVLTIA